MAGPVHSLATVMSKFFSVGLTLPGGWTRTATAADWKRGNAPALPDRVPAVFALLA